MSRPRTRILLASGILSIALALAWGFLHQREEPIYRGRTVSQWLTRIQEGQWSADDRAPIRAIGTNGIPSYLRWISFEESPQRIRIAKLVEPIFPRFSYRLVSSPGGLANRVVCAFEILGPQARTAVPELTRLALTARDPARARRCLNSLGFIGPDAIPSILALTTNSPPEIRSFAFWKLADFGTNNPAILAALRLALADSDPYMTNAASRVLLKIAPDLLTNTLDQ
jgi:hypothetical protein